MRISNYFWVCIVIPRCMLKRFVLLPASLFILINCMGQQQKVVADMIAGIVGDKIILRSELATAIADTAPACRD